MWLLSFITVNTNENVTLDKKYQKQSLNNDE